MLQFDSYSNIFMRELIFLLILILACDNLFVAQNVYFVYVLSKSSVLAHVPIIQFPNILRMYI